MSKRVLSTLIFTLAVATGCTPKLDGASMASLTQSTDEVFESEPADVKHRFLLSFPILGDKALKYYGGLNLEEALAAEQKFRDFRVRIQSKGSQIYLFYFRG